LSPHPNPLPKEREILCPFSPSGEGWDEGETKLPPQGEGNKLTKRCPLAPQIVHPNK